ncbi:MAG: hypothetical protein M1827_006416 [Pycnora praestabilis]|nr:MAG: hypothetical protein M1827_006416 [Pycnora praestabilis]
MDERAAVPPGLPRANPTTSYWQNPPDLIANLRSTEQLSQDTDIIIIGSGITGSCVAFNILEQCPGSKIIMLEARQACSGATGRNGGHTKHASYRSFMHNSRTLGVQEAMKIARLEYDCMKAVHAFARKHRINCDLQPIDTVDIFFDQSEFDDALQAVEYMRKVLKPGEGAARYTVYVRDQTRTKFLTPTALGALTYEAGSLSAYRFVIGTLKLALEKGLNLQTNTPALSISPSTDPTSKKRKWIVETSRGPINASKVVLATNGYTAQLCPELQGVIVPLRGQIAAHRPGSGMPAYGLPTTYSFIYQDGYEYMIQQPSDSRYEMDIIIGGGLTKAKEEGVEEYGNTDDTTLNLLISQYLTETTVKYFGKNWGKDSNEGRIRREWTGIMGFSADGFPLIGEVPGDRGLFIAASFQGHGMVLCFLCANALTEMLFDKDEENLNAWFPQAFKVRRERFQHKLTGRLHDKPTKDLEVKSQL